MQVAFTLSHHTIISGQNRLYNVYHTDSGNSKDTKRSTALYR